MVLWEDYGCGFQSKLRDLKNMEAEEGLKHAKEVVEGHTLLGRIFGWPYGIARYEASLQFLIDSKVLPKEVSNPRSRRDLERLYSGTWKGYTRIEVPKNQVSLDLDYHLSATISTTSPDLSL